MIAELYSNDNKNLLKFEIIYIEKLYEYHFFTVELNRNRLIDNATLFTSIIDESLSYEF